MLQDILYNHVAIIEIFMAAMAHVQFHLRVRSPDVPGAAVLAVDPCAGGEGGEGDLGEDEVDLGDQDQPSGRPQASAEAPHVSGHTIII